MSTPERAAARHRQSRRERIVLVLVVVVLAYALLCGLLMLFETNLVYPGSFVDTNTQEEPKSGVGLEHVVYQSSDGTPLVGLLLDRGKRSTVLYLHGNAEHAARMGPWISQLADVLDANVMAAEFRGYADDLTPGEDAVITDCEAARGYLCKRYGIRPDQIVLYGRSLGGGCAVALAATGGARVLVLERTFDRLVDVGAKKYPFLPVRFLMRNPYDSVQRIQNYDGPLVQIHGTSDTLIPIEHGKNLFDAAPTPDKSWIPVPDLGHNDRLPKSILNQIADEVGQHTIGTAGLLKHTSEE